MTIPRNITAIRLQRAERAEEGTMELERIPLPYPWQEPGEDMTRENLIAAFWQLYQRGESISATAVAAAAGYHRTTFYRHFSDVRDVLNQFEEKLVCREKVLSLQVRYLSGALNRRGLLKEIGPILHGTLPAWATLLGERGDPEFRALCEALWRPIILTRLRREMGPEWAESRADFILSGCLGALQRIGARTPTPTGAQAAAMLAECLEMQD